jgi:predicted transcriptional regulator
LHAEGHGQREIARLLGIPTSTVHDWLSGSGHPQSSHRRTGPSSSKAEKVAGQLARAVVALDRIDEEDEEAIVLALIEALGPDGIELLAAVSEVLQEELSRV